MDGHCQTTSFSGSIQTKGLLACSCALTGQGLFSFSVLLFTFFQASLFHTRWQSSVFCLRVDLVNDSSPWRHNTVPAHRFLSRHTHTLLLCSDCSSLFVFTFFFFDSKHYLDMTSGCELFHQ